LIGSALLVRSRRLAVVGLVAVAGCASAGTGSTAAREPSSDGGAVRTINIEVSHTLAREGALVIWLSREGERWAFELGRIIPPSSQAFQVELESPQNTWVLAAARATSPRVPVITSRSFVIERGAEWIMWDVSMNTVRMR
jgi:hypothetical protein